MTDIATERWDLLWAVQRSQRYHARRQAFFARWHKATAFAGVLGGSAVLATLGPHLPAWAGLSGALLVVLMSSIDLVVGTSEMAHRHHDLRRRFATLEAAITRAPTPDAATLAEWTAIRVAIEADEPPTYVALDLLCENELARSYPHLAAPREPVPWYKALTAQLLPWANA